MKRILPLVFVFAACGGGSGYDGPGKALVGGWLGDLTTEATVDGQPWSNDSSGVVVDLHADGDALTLNDGDCAYPAEGDGDDRLVFLSADDGCVWSVGGAPMRLAVDSGTGSLNGEFANFELTGTLTAVSGGATGTFTYFFRGEPYSGPSGEDGEGPGGGGGDSGSTGG